MGPLEFEPIIKSIRWGGSRLGSELNKTLDGRTDAAESWEIADQPDGRSVVSSGPLRGRTLSSLLDSHTAEIFGDHPSHTQFPLLIKFLDAHDRLSLQVHPDNDQAVAYGVDQRGKTEAWFIMAAEPDSQIYAGLKAGVDRQDLENAIVTGRIEACLHRYHVEAGQAVFIPAGTVHAIGEGILLAEVQQQSNLTFRLYDWGRVGVDGQPRELHLEQALACIDFDRGPVDCAEPRDLTAEVSWAGRSDFDVVERLVECAFFAMDRCSTQQSCSIQTRGQFRILMITGGQGTLSGTQTKIHLEVGKTVLLPARCESLIVEPESPLTWLETFVPDPNCASAEHRPTTAVDW